MPSLLNNSLSGLLAARTGIAVTSHNIANANTDGYSRQRVHQAARSPAFYGGNYIGVGVAVTDVSRIYDSFLVEQARVARSDETQLSAFHELATRVDQLFGNEAAGLAGATSDFFSAVDGLARDPASLPARQTVISQAQSLADRFATLDGQLATIDDEVDARIYSGVETVNSLSGSIARLNEMIASAQGESPDLMDQRDLLLGELSAQVDISVLDQPDGTINVFVGAGQPLVTGTVSYAVTAMTDPFDPERLAVGFGSPPQQIPEGQLGGALGGALEFRRTLLDPARAELGRIATGLAASFNAVHATGTDLAGQPGGEFFALPPARVLAASDNAGAASVAVSIDDVGALRPRNYELSFGGGAWQLLDVASGETVAMTGSGSAADPFVVDGLSIVAGAGAADGDRFRLQPLAPAASALGVSVTSPAGLAAASPIVASGALGNSGNASPSGVLAEDPAAPALLDTVNIVFDDAATYRIVDAGGADLTGPLAYSAGDDVVFNGWRLSLAGVPAGGDSFRVEANLAGGGDNSVARRLSTLARDGVFDAGTASVDDLQSTLLAQVGIATQQAGMGLEAQVAVRQQAELAVDSVSGVNLDEEAVNLMRYQEAYEASARAIAVADSLFQTILDVLR